MRRARASEQRGSMVVVLLAVLVLLGTYAMFHSLDIAAVRVERDRVTNEALAKAKEALVAYAASDANRPGELPCPDVDDDGAATPAVDYIGSACASLIGRLPWKTLGLPDLRDDSGERLWYAVSDDFHASGSVALNSDTAFVPTTNTSLTLTGQQAGTNLVALVFAPGAPVLRDGAAALQSRSAAGALNAANYLDIANGEDNADANRVFVAADKSQSFNDRILPIHSDDIMWLVQRRAAREYAQHLRDHYDAWKNAVPPAGITFTGFKGFYPWAAPLNDPTTKQPGVNNTTNGQLPLSSASLVWSSGAAPPFGTCSGVGTSELLCTTLIGGVLMTITGTVANVGTAFVDPPTAANAQVVNGIAFGPSTTWTLNPGAQTLTFTWTSVVSVATRVKLLVPTASAWTTSTWLDQNHWYEDAFYAVSPGYALSGSNSCPPCVSVAGAANKQAVVLMAGRALPLASPAQGARPLTAPVAATQLFEGLNATPSALVYEQRLRSSAFNDLPIAVRP